MECDLLLQLASETLLEARRVIVDREMTPAGIELLKRIDQLMTDIYVYRLPKS